MNDAHRSTLYLAATALALSTSSTLAEVIYDNTLEPTGARTQSLELGDEVRTGGFGRVCTELLIGVHMSEAGTADLQAQLYANDGPGGEPGTLLWQSSIREDTEIAEGDSLISFDVPFVTLPEVFTWSLKVLFSQPVGVSLPSYGPPTIGSSPEYGWSGGPGNWRTLEFGDPLDLMARVVARDDLRIESVDSSCPEAGPLSVSWAGATPGRLVGLVRSPAPGTLIVPAGRPCAGLDMELSRPGARLAFFGQAGADGTRTLEAEVEADVCGDHLQLVDVFTCQKSNVVVVD